jgi:hypothetical protein
MARGTRGLVRSRRPVTTPTAPARRLDSVDLLRGLIMIVMALDHTRDFFGVPGVSPTNLAQATGPLFFTRWITHFCAPVFFLLTGTGASLSLARRSRAGLSWFLFTRGAWLVVLELTASRCIGFQFNVDYHVTLLVVLWALGWAMIATADAVSLATRVGADDRVRAAENAQRVRRPGAVENAAIRRVHRHFLLQRHQVTIPSRRPQAGAIRCRSSTRFGSAWSSRSIRPAAGLRR